ncbi:fatty acid CoA ligase family protein [Bythopirellula goksoeyrii]|uniref:Long-chain-fatty-acid--CoA ligase n=1 Tax=Bythopirellula goksoeyrii TaxID=1400387 RepID=A0A5B9QJQ7_9BACT|nr:fatty acid CoA ligase family protein [Bythopirellula goksoeyrii]QEG34391.1 Long-chain-fatty-acid--CoA ligase [Bythopirellula goksoeyrii]
MTSAVEHHTVVQINVADRLAHFAQRMPLSVAVACPGHGDAAGRNSYATCTFAELDRDATALARGLVDLGVTPGTRLVLLVKPGVEFVKLVFALLRSGATTILIDPGMGKKHLVNCLAAAEPAGFVAISPAQAVRTLLKSRFPQAKLNVTVGRRWFWGGTTYKQLLSAGTNSGTRLPTSRATDPAAIIFTSGSTGPPKGVLYTHQMFDTQVAEIRREYDLQPGGADLACFALFGLFNSAMGITTVFPKMDFSRPASADPRKLLSAASDWQVTQAFGSPAVWDKLSRYCEHHGEQIPTLRKIFSCGAPVPAKVLQRTLAYVDAYAEMHTPYGATESLPVATIAASEVLSETAEQTACGAGVCVGRKFESIDWRVIRISDEPITNIADVEELPMGEIGELIVRGPQVSPQYDGELRVASCELREKESTRVSKLASHNSMTKITDGISIWHRMGDVGYLDSQGRFWYCGRKNHRIETSEGTLFSVPCEEIFNTHPDVARTALVGIGPAGGATPLLVVEPSGTLLRRCGKNWSRSDYHRLQAELLELAKGYEITKHIAQPIFHPGLPVDVRHNSKINREQLAKWATRELGGHKLQH